MTVKMKSCTKVMLYIISLVVYIYIINVPFDCSTKIPSNKSLWEY